jgi:UDP-N-acetylmuramyl pentapeptide phosphotransferase/UDP-N-acetylglucosamine-1-phosphate transferase
VGSVGTGVGASVVAAGLGALATAGTGWVLRRRPPGGAQAWARTNHRGEPVTLLAGPAVALGAAAAVVVAPGLPARARTAALVAAATSGALGAYDDLVGTGRDRGFRGHLAALRRGEVSTGALKIAGIGAAGLLAGALVRGGLAERILAGGVVAGTANVVNLLDLRPGRALKVVLALAAVEVIASGRCRDPAALASRTLASAAIGAASCALPADLGERTMLGDAGANALGALVGLAAATRSSRRGLVVRFGVLVALTAASERVSFTAVIAATPGLRELDGLGRRPR